MYVPISNTSIHPYIHTTRLHIALWESKSKTVNNILKHTTLYGKGLVCVGGEDKTEKVDPVLIIR
jgi:hypothetical protein